MKRRAILMILIAGMLLQACSIREKPETEEFPGPVVEEVQTIALEEAMASYKPDGTIVYNSGYNVYMGTIGDKAADIVLYRTGEAHQEMLYVILDDVKTGYPLGKNGLVLENEILYDQEEAKIGLVAAVMNTDGGEADAITGVYSTDGVTYQQIVMRLSYIAGEFENLEETERFAREIRSDILDHNMENLSRKIQYPVIIMVDGVQQEIAAREEFLKLSFDSLFSEKFVQAIADDSGYFPFNNWGGFMLGNGEIWFDRTGGEYCITVFNNAEE